MKFPLNFLEDYMYIRGVKRAAQARPGPVLFKKARPGNFFTAQARPGPVFIFKSPARARPGQFLKAQARPKPVFFRAGPSARPKAQAALTPLVQNSSKN